jgi:hypothetical protein
MQDPPSTSTTLNIFITLPSIVRAHPPQTPQAAAAYVGLGLCAVVAGLAIDGKEALAAVAHWAVGRKPRAAELDDDWVLLAEAPERGEA